VSVITKVFVVLLTVFSIAFAMSAISFVSRSNNWRQVAQDYEDVALSAQAEARILAAQMKLTHDQDLAKITQLGNDVANLTGQLAAKTGEIGNLTSDLAQSETKNTSLQGTVSGLEQRLGVTQTQLVSEQDFARKLASRNNELERRNIDLNDRTKELTVGLAMAHTQNRAYLEQIAALEDRLEKMARVAPGQLPDAGTVVQAGVPTAQPSEGPAVSPIRGEVLSVENNLASINVGYADGVTRGMSFMIYRAGTDGGAGPTYVATLEVSRVEANQAAGQIVRKNNDIRIGDKVRDDASFARRG